jgi:hypothetical protein
MAQLGHHLCSAAATGYSNIMYAACMRHAKDAPTALDATHLTSSSFQLLLTNTFPFNPLFARRHPTPCAVICAPAWHPAAAAQLQPQQPGQPVGGAASGIREAAGGPHQPG